MAENTNCGYFITYGPAHTLADGTSLSRCYTKIPRLTENEARDFVNGIRGPKWSMIYPIDDLPRQREKYGLIEVMVEDAILPKSQQLAPMGE